MNTIFLRQLKAQTIIGVYESEQQHAQPVEIDLEISLPNDAACHSDQIGDTIDYQQITDCIDSLLHQRRFLLIEALAEAIAQMIQQKFSSPWIRVSISKPGILPNVGQIGVTIERGHLPT